MTGIDGAVASPLQNGGQAPAADLSDLLSFLSAEYVVDWQVADGGLRRPDTPEK